MNTERDRIARELRERWFRASGKIAADDWLEVADYVLADRRAVAERVRTWIAKGLETQNAASARFVRELGFGGDAVMNEVARMPSLAEQRDAALDLLVDVWMQFAVVAEPFREGGGIHDPRHDGCLSTLEDVREALRVAGRLKPYADRTKDWWVLIGAALERQTTATLEEK